MEGLVWVNENLHGSAAFNNFVSFFTSLGDGGYIWLIIAAVLLCFKKTRVSALVMMISLAVGAIINDTILKEIFARPRPFSVNEDFKVFIESVGYELPSGFSFPSGHTFSSFNCAVVLTLFNKKMGYFTIPLAALIGLSRIFMCVHYPTDVLAGAVCGILTALAVYALYLLVVRKIVAFKRNKVRKGARL